MKSLKKILLLTDSFQCLTQRLFVELIEKNYDVSVEFDINPAITIEAVKLFQPDLIIAPYLKSKIPYEIYSKVLCWIIHPGIKGDRGPSSLDYAILREKKIWGVSIIQAEEDWDSGDIWFSLEFPMRFTRKSSIYRREVTDTAVNAIFEALNKLNEGVFPEKQENLFVQWNPYLKQEKRKIDWENDSTREILKKIYASDGYPGVLDVIKQKEVYLFDAWEEKELAIEFKNKPVGSWLAIRNQAICRKTKDGAIWIGHMKLKSTEKPTMKLPSLYLFPEFYKFLPKIPVGYSKQSETYQEIFYELKNDIALIYFNFYNGAMSSEQCYRLGECYREVKSKSVKAIILFGGEDFWSNGIHLNTIEYAESSSDESWKNINAIDDVCKMILEDTEHLTIAGLRGNAAAGGVFFALCCDWVFARKGIILNPHYKNMGNLYGSEYWTYVLPKRVSEANIKNLLENRLPISAGYAKEIGLVDEVIEDTIDFEERVLQGVQNFLKTSEFYKFIEQKKQNRLKDEAEKPLDSYRSEELLKMYQNFYGFDPSYHIARYYFVYKIRNFRTPLYLAKHRSITKSEKQISSF